MAEPDLDLELDHRYRQEADRLRASLLRASHGDRQLADDVAQESWLRAIRYWPSHGVPDRPAAWLRTVARNILFDEHRRRPGVPLDHVPAGTLQAPDEGAALETREQHTILHAALAELPPDGRYLIESHYFAGHSLARIAEGLDLSERAVERRLRRTRLRLRTVLESRGVTTAELRGFEPTLALSLSTIVKAIFMTALLPFLLAIVIYAIGRAFYARRTQRSRIVGRLAGGIFLIVLATFGARHPLGLQVFGAGMFLFGCWEWWRMRVVRAEG